jgi:hypothetical protein
LTRAGSPDPDPRIDLGGISYSLGVPTCFTVSTQRPTRTNGAQPVWDGPVCRQGTAKVAAGPARRLPALCRRSAAPAVPGLRTRRAGPGCPAPAGACRRALQRSCRSLPLDDQRVEMRHEDGRGDVVHRPECDDGAAGPGREEGASEAQELVTPDWATCTGLASAEHHEVGGRMSTHVRVRRASQGHLTSGSNHSPIRHVLRSNNATEPRRGHDEIAADESAGRRLVVAFTELVKAI